MEALTLLKIIGVIGIVDALLIIYYGAYGIIKHERSNGAWPVRKKLNPEAEARLQRYVESSKRLQKSSGWAEEE